MINPNNITNVSFAASPALQALLNNNGVNNPITPINAPREVTTTSYLVQNPTIQQGSQAAVLEKTPKTDVYEPMHKKHDENGGKKEHKALKAVGITASIAAVIALILFSPKLAEKFLKDIDVTQPLVKGKEAFKTENIKLALKKFTSQVEKFEQQISQDYQNGGFVSKQIERISSAFKEGGFVNRNARKVKDAFSKDGAIGKRFASLFSKKAEAGAQVVEDIAEAGENITGAMGALRG